MRQTIPTRNPITSLVSPSTVWKEKIEPDETQLFEDFANRVIAAQQKEVAQETGGPLLRGFHAKPHAGLVARFKVLADLPEYARYGVFSEPRVFDAVVRFSNGRPKPQSDKIPDPRGIAIKLIGVPGPKLLEGEKYAVTQDFLATSHSVTSTVRNARQFMTFIEAERSTAPLRFARARLALALARTEGARESARILYALIRTVSLSKVRSMATEEYLGTAPIQFGPYAVKFTVRPAEGTAAPTRRPLREDFLREELTDRLRNGDLVFDFLIQFYVDDEHTPIEDTSVRWKPEYAPFVKVAQLRIPKCDLVNDPHTAAVSERVNQLSFTPWHSIEDHRPLGSVMRARRVAYQLSSDLRGHSPEPTSLPL